MCRDSSPTWRGALRSVPSLRVVLGWAGCRQRTAARMMGSATSTPCVGNGLHRSPRRPSLDEHVVDLRTLGFRGAGRHRARCGGGSIVGLAGLFALCACSRGGSDLAAGRRLPDTPAGAPVDFVGSDPTAAAPLTGDLGTVDANALLGVDPAHGPFRGGQTALIRG